MKKKLLSLLIVMTMVLSLAACGKSAATSENSIDKVVENISAFDAKQVEMEGTLTGSIEGETLDYSGKMIVAQIDDKSCAVELQYKLNGTYVPVTTIFATDKAIYVNLKQGLDFAGQISSQYKILSSYLTLSNDYVMVTYDELVTYLEAAGVDTSDISLDALQNQATTNSKESVQASINFLKELADKSGVSFLTAKDDALNIDISADDFEKVVSALADMDMASYISQNAPQVITGSTDDFNTEFKNEMSDLKSAITQDGLKLTVNSSIKPEGKSGERTNNMTFKVNATDATTDNAEIGLTATAYEKSTASYTVPENAATLTELMLLLNKLGM